MSTKLVERGARIRRTKWVELSCLLCGEAVGTLEGGTVLRFDPDTTRVPAAGPEGLTMIAVGARRGSYEPRGPF